MPSGPLAIGVAGVMAITAGAGGYALWRSEATAPIVGVVRTTEIRVVPEVGGQLLSIKEHKGEAVRVGDVVGPGRALSGLHKIYQGIP